LCYTKDVAPKTFREVPKTKKGRDDFKVVPSDPHEHHGNPSM
jgi:hypothetical protein